MSGDTTGRGLTGLFARLGQRRPSAEPADAAPETAAQPGTVYATKALRKFLATIQTREAPVLLDLGPVIGSNVTFFGEQLGCKIFVEDLFADLERHARGGKLEDLPAFLETRFTQPAGSVDGILAWDLIDYLDPAAAQVVATTLSRLMRVDGALLAFFGTTPARDVSYTKYVVVDEVSLRHRPYAGSRGRHRVLQNRDIIKLFDGLRVSDSFLLQTHMREILFRKPAYLAAAPGA